MTVSQHLYQENKSVPRVKTYSFGGALAGLRLLAVQPLTHLVNGTLTDTHTV